MSVINNLHLSNTVKYKVHQESRGLTECLLYRRMLQQNSRVLEESEREREREGRDLYSMTTVAHFSLQLLAFI